MLTVKEVLTNKIALDIECIDGVLILPQLLETFGYTHANPLGVRLAFPVIAVFILVGYLIFQRYRIGDTPEETQRNLNLAEA